jgi:hypothetical protein
MSCCSAVKELGHIIWEEMTVAACVIVLFYNCSDVCNDRCKDVEGFDEVQRSEDVPVSGSFSGSDRR